MLKLKLKNYRRFLETDVIVFPSGLTIVTGPNGAGKTTLVESLSYTLFGPKKGPRGGGVRSDNATDELEVYSVLQIDGHDVQVLRKGDMAELWLDGTLQVPRQPGSVAQVNRQISQLLGGLTREQFEEIYVAEQGQTAGLVAARPKGRLDLLNVALQLDVLEEACTRQEEERNHRFTRVSTLADVAVDDLGLAAEERGALDELRRARAAHTRRQHLDRFLDQAEQGVARLNEVANEATQTRKAAEAEVVVEERARDARQAEVDLAREGLQAHEDRERAFVAFDGPLAGQEALRQQAEENAAKKRGEIKAAQGCASAARRHRAAKAVLDAIQARLRRLPRGEARWQAVRSALRELWEKERALRKLGDPESVLHKANETARKAKARWEALQDDPTAEETTALNQREGELQAREQDASAALTTLEDTARDAPCPTCGQPLDAHAREERLRHLQTWLDDGLPKLRRGLQAKKGELSRKRLEWQSQRTQAQRAWVQATEAVNTAKAQVSRLNLLREQRTSAGVKLDRAREAWRELKCTQVWDPADWGSAEQGRLEAERLRLIERVRKLQADAERYASLERLKGEFQAEQEKARRATEELERLQAEQAATGYEAEAHEQCKANLQAAKDELEHRKEALRDAEGELERRKGEERAALEAAKRGAETQVKLKEAASDYRREEQLLGLLEGFRGHFFAANTEEIARRASQLIAQAVTDGSILGVRFERGGDLYYLDASHARQPVSRLSGGEKALVGLCLRIAVAEQALRLARTGKLHFLVLDEVLSSLDDERREAMQRVFDDVQRRGIFEHVIMITHLDAVRHGWQGAGLRVEKVGPKSSRVVAETATGAATDGAVDPIDAESAEVAHA